MSWKRTAVPAATSYPRCRRAMRVFQRTQARIGGTQTCLRRDPLVEERPPVRAKPSVHHSPYRVQVRGPVVVRAIPGSRQAMHAGASLVQGVGICRPGRRLKRTGVVQRPLLFLAVGERGFEPPTSASRTLRANRAAPLPATAGAYHGECSACNWHGDGRMSGHRRRLPHHTPMTYKQGTLPR